MGVCRLLGGQVWDDMRFVRNVEKLLSVDGEDLTLRLNEDDLITPGLIDFHGHFWSPAASTPFGVDSSKMFMEGIIGGVDAGSFGSSNWKIANSYWQKDCDMKIKSFISILPEGLSIFPPVNPTRPEKINTNNLVEFIQQNVAGGNLLGTKVQLGWLSYKDIDTDRQLLKIARNVADKTNTNIMVHISGQCIDIEETVSYLGFGDIITHIYSGFDNTVLTEKGTVSNAIHKAHQKGILFDVGHAGKHFSWKVFNIAYAEGVSFDMLGGDITVKSWKNKIDFKVYDLFHLLSGFLNYGVQIDEVFRAVITTPAKFMGFHPNIDERCLVLRKRASDSELTDGVGGSVKCRFEYGPELFVDRGKVIRKNSN